MKGLVIAASLILSSTALLAETAQKDLADAANVFNEIMATPDKGIPQDLLEKSSCIIIVPGLKKAAFVVGGQFGRGFATCRKDSGRRSLCTAVEFSAVRQPGYRLRAGRHRGAPPRSPNQPGVTGGRPSRSAACGVRWITCWAAAGGCRKSSGSRPRS